MMTAANALVIMAKAPEPGQSKTRLVPPLSFEQAAELARALLVDQLENLRDFTAARLFVNFAPDGSAGFFQKLGRGDFSCFPQRGDSLGKRMLEAFRFLFERGFRRVVLIGSDLPPVPLDFFAQAYAILERPDRDVVLGPSTDGGYYLVGMRRPIPEMFEGFAWSRDDVLARTRAKLDELHINHELLPFWYDIDTAEDLGRLPSIDDCGETGMQNTLTLLRELRQRGTV